MLWWSPSWLVNRLVANLKVKKNAGFIFFVYRENIKNLLVWAIHRIYSLLAAFRGLSACDIGVSLLLNQSSTTILNAIDCAPTKQLTYMDSQSVTVSNVPGKIMTLGLVSRFPPRSRWGKQNHDWEEVGQLQGQTSWNIEHLSAVCFSKDLGETSSSPFRLVDVSGRMQWHRFPALQW